MHRDPPHYLKPLITTKTPKRMLWLACTGRGRKEGDAYVERFDAAALGKTWYTRSKDERRDTTATYDAPGDLWADVDNWCPVGRRVVLFTYDLPRVMRLSGMLTHMGARGWGIDKIVLEKTAAWALLRRGKRSLMLCDLRAWCPVEWHKIVADTALANSEHRVIRSGASYTADRCLFHASVIRDATLQILHFIEGENLGPFRPTGSGQSYAGYRRRFMQSRLLVHDDVDRLRSERLGMHTGRAEAWRHGTTPRGRYAEFDLHAAYATIGRDCDIPTVARGQLSQPTTQRIERAMRTYAVLADVTVTTDVECLPYNNNGRTVWPTGTFRTTVWDPEIKLALHHCSEVRFNHAYLYAREPALSNFCDYVLRGMSGQTQVYGLIPLRVLKHWSRCLVGRMGLRFRAWHKFGPCDPPDVRMVTYLDVDDGTRTDMLMAGTQILLLGNLEESTESLPQIPGWIMSECRRRLFDAMRVVNENGTLLYVDTDSIICDSPGAAALQGYAEAIGERWLPKNSFDQLTIYGPRNLEAGKDRRVSGLPLSAKQSAPLEFTGEVMRSVKQSMRSGDFDLITSLPRTFHIKPQDLRRRHNADGTTYPFRIEESHVD